MAGKPDAYNLPTGRKLQLRLMQYQVEEFDVDGPFSRWEGVIKDAHKKEQDRIEGQLACMTVYDDELADIAAEENAMAEDLFREMYAALIVAMWGRIETLLKDATRSYKQAHTKYRGKPEDDMQRRQMYKFWDVVKRIKKYYGEDLKKYTGFKEINAARILNNCYKHNDGVYIKPKCKKEQIDEELLKSWSIISACGRIEYEKLSITELLASCKAFGDKLLSLLKERWGSTV